MTNEEIQTIAAKAEAEYENLKDRVHDLYDQNQEKEKRINKALKYIDGLFKEVLLQTQTVVAIRVIERILTDDEEA